MSSSPPSAFTSLAWAAFLRVTPLGSCHFTSTGTTTGKRLLLRCSAFLGGGLAVALSIVRARVLLLEYLCVVYSLGTIFTKWKLLRVPMSPKSRVAGSRFSRSQRLRIKLSGSPPKSYSNCLRAYSNTDVYSNPTTRLRMMPLRSRRIVVGMPRMPKRFSTSGEPTSSV